MTPYLQRRALYPPLIQEPPVSDLGIVVVLPAREEPDLLRSLQSLRDGDRPEGGVEVIVVINEPEGAPEAVSARNRESLYAVRKWAARYNGDGFSCFVLHQTLPARHAGVGLARKIGMDEACRRLETVGNPRGVIACFDADSRCDPNYLRALENHFAVHPDCPACSIYFEHPLAGSEFDEPVYRAIAEYELHLRYYVQAQRWAGFPHAFHTVGSSMAVRCADYQRQGGMNRRKAGEDFYFIHKFTPLPGFATLNDTRVIPSPRPSHRVPFGTGRAIGEMLADERGYESYHPSTFEELRRFLQGLPAFYKKDRRPDLSEYPEMLRDFLLQQSFGEKLEELRAHSAAYDTFRDRFFRWFNAFLVMKYAHFARDRGRADVPVAGAAAWLLQQKERVPERRDVRSLLETFRKLDRGMV